MTKVVIAEYDAEKHSLVLEEPLEGVQDREKLTIRIEEALAKNEAQPWLAFHGCLKGEAGDDLARAIDKLNDLWIAALRPTRHSTTRHRSRLPRHSAPSPARSVEAESSVLAARCVRAID